MSCLTLLFGDQEFLLDKEKIRWPGCVFWGGESGLINEKGLQTKLKNRSQQVDKHFGPKKVHYLF